MNILPSLFVSHGAPTFALEPGLAGPRLRALGEALPRPRAILIISPHWMTRDLRITGNAAPETIHDFGGFAPALYRLQYPAAGHPALASELAELLTEAGWPASLDLQRGLDHGAWVPLLHLYPQADIPVLQLSMPTDLEPESAYALGQALAPLSNQGILVIGSGSLTHNLYEALGHSPGDAEYASEFSAWVRNAVHNGQHQQLKQTLTLAPHASRAHPTSEHFLPLLVALGAAHGRTDATVLEGGLDYGVLSMDSFVFGASLTGI